MQRRPDHPDLQELAILVNLYDDAIDVEPTNEAKQRVFEMIAIDKVDAEAAAYMGIQRALRAYEATNLQQLGERLGDVMMGATLWVEALLVGVELERRRTRRTQGG